MSAACFYQQVLCSTRHAHWHILNTLLVVFVDVDNTMDI